MRNQPVQSVWLVADSMRGLLAITTILANTAFRISRELFWFNAVVFTVGGIVMLEKVWLAVFRVWFG